MFFVVYCKYVRIDKDLVVLVVETGPAIIGLQAIVIWERHVIR